MTEIPEKLFNYLIELAQKYETSSFITNDPSRVLYRYKDKADIEVASFICAMLSFGKRDQFLKKTDIILNLMDQNGGPANWIRSGLYKQTFIEKQIALDQSYKTFLQSKFYRFYSYNDMISLFNELNKILLSYYDLGTYFKHIYSKSDTTIPFCTIISNIFCSCCIVPHSTTCANKRVNMFLRWMVRQNSPVDIGLWSWYPQEKLIIPLDTHVLHMAKELKLIPQTSSGTLKTAQQLTDVFKQIWPLDPCRGDFALFGLGINSATTNKLSINRGIYEKI